MKVLITGATGYIGGSVAERLVALGHDVSGLVRSANKIPLLKERRIEPILSYHSISQFSVDFCLKTWLFGPG